MGRLKLDCIASHPDNTVVYGIANAAPEGLKSGFTKETSTTVLVRSDPNPATFKSISWSFIAATPTKNLFNYWKQGPGIVDCAVSRSGVFSAFYPPREIPLAANRTEWAGFKYDPSLGFPGTGEWKVLGTSPGYWPSSFWQSAESIFVDQPVPSGAGAGAGGQQTRETLVHAVTRPTRDTIRALTPVTGSSSDLIQFGQFDLNETNPLLNTTSWTFPRPANVTRLGQGHLHTYDRSVGTLTSYPLTNLTATMPKGIVSRAKDGIDVKYILTGTRNNTSFLACIGVTYDRKQQLYFIDDYLTDKNSTSPTYDIKGSNVGTVLQFIGGTLNLQFIRGVHPNGVEFPFAIALKDDSIVGINLGGNQSIIGETAMTRLVWISEAFDSFVSEAPIHKGIPDNGNASPYSTVGIIATVAAVMLFLFLGYKVWQFQSGRHFKRGTGAAAPIPTTIIAPYSSQPPHGQSIGLSQPVAPYSYHNSSSRHDASEDAPPPYRA
ncbi:hypothetical protein BGX29_000760 [Mortierella sp. GBA35]|nr:hypothetical protein BGX29_000760 [Mortierella sp. GBA35]